MKKFFAVLALATVVGSASVAFTTKVEASSASTQHLIRSDENVGTVNQAGCADSCNKIIITRCKS
jgi:hypothetical protein